jgi:hypothetical protein
MPSPEQFREQIERELATARAARAAGNDGMARVCARRAAGAALTWYQTIHARPWRTDAMRQLAGAAAEPAFPVAVREAAARLVAKITPEFAYPPGADALADAQTVIDHVLVAVGGSHGAP